MTRKPAPAAPEAPADLLPADLLPADLLDENLLDEDRQHYRRVLNELVDIGADFARLLHQQAKAQAQVEQPETAPAARPVISEITLADLTIAFDRVARAIRRTVSLARRLAEPVPLAANPGQNRILARKRIIREVEDHIQRRPRGPEAEILHNELSARLDAPDLDDDIDNRPVADIIADICRDLGLDNLPGSQTWKRRTPEDVASLCARAARARMKARSPFPFGPDPPRSCVPPKRLRSPPATAEAEDRKFA